MVRMLFSCTIASLVFVSACSSQRNIVAVRESGSKNLVKGNLDEALVDWAEAVDRDPGDYRGRVGLGQTFMVLERPLDAREQFEIAFNLRRHDGELLDLLCESMIASGQLADLHNLLEDRAQTRQTPAEWFRFGRYSAQVGDIDTAERAFLTAAKLDGGQSAEYQLVLADFYEGLGDTGETLRRLRMVLFLDPENLMIHDRIRAIGEVPGPSFALQPDEMEQ